VTRCFHKGVALQVEHRQTGNCSDNSQDFISIKLVVSYHDCLEFAALCQVRDGRRCCKGVFAHVEGLKPGQMSQSLQVRQPVARKVQSDEIRKLICVADLGNEVVLQKKRRQSFAARQPLQRFDSVVLEPQRPDSCVALQIGDRSEALVVKIKFIIKFGRFIAIVLQASVCTSGK